MNGFWGQVKRTLKFYAIAVHAKPYVQRFDAFCTIANLFLTLS